jgi:hypothetical protein
MYVLFLQGCRALLTSIQCQEDLTLFRDMHHITSREALGRDMFYTCQLQDYENLSVEAVMRRISETHLVVLDMVPPCAYQYDEDSLLEIFGTRDDLPMIGRDMGLYW